MDLIDDAQCSWVCPGSRTFLFHSADMRAGWLTDGRFVQVYEFCGGSRRIDLYKKTGDVATPVQGPVYPPAGAKLTQVFTA